MRFQCNKWDYSVKSKPPQPSFQCHKRDSSVTIAFVVSVVSKFKIISRNILSWKNRSIGLYKCILAVTSGYRVCRQFCKKKKISSGTNMCRTRPQRPDNEQAVRHYQRGASSAVLKLVLATAPRMAWGWEGFRNFSSVDEENFHPRACWLSCCIVCWAAFSPLGFRPCWWMIAATWSPSSRRKTHLIRSPFLLSPSAVPVALNTHVYIIHRHHFIHITSPQPFLFPCCQVWTRANVETMGWSRIGVAIINDEDITTVELPLN